jgi:hypothetical protein
MLCNLPPSCSQCCLSPVSCLIYADPFFAFSTSLACIKF